MTTKRPVISELNDRSREIFMKIVESFVETGEPIGSRSLSQQLSTHLSPATIRNVMADLEDFGLLFAPHTSAGRMPTDLGLRMFVDGLLEVGNLSSDERNDLDSRLAGTGKSLESVLEEAGSMLSGLSNCAGLVLAPTTDSPLKHIEFVNLSPGKALVVMVTAEGVVENRILEVPRDIPASAFTEATNYLNARLVGRTIAEARSSINAEIEQSKIQLNKLSAKVVEAGLATWAGDAASGNVRGTLIVRGQANLLEDVNAIDNLERIRALFSALETNETMLKILELADTAEGVQIFIGADNELFNLSGCSFIVAPYHSSSSQLVGAIGIIGPTRMNYARIIPMVDYTAKLIGKIMG
ncbi:MAG: heat-inducible transcriptional repressor HrcA [Rhodospirillales bacterium]|jgi:heat-inducible transcriptional repressor